MKIIPTDTLLSSINMKQQRPIGQLKVKMRLRKPITDAMRFHKDLNDVKSQLRDKNVSLY